MPLRKADDSSMPLGRSRITARDLSWAEPWVIQNQTTLTELRSAKHYANDCKRNDSTLETSACVMNDLRVFSVLSQ